MVMGDRVVRPGLVAGAVPVSMALTVSTGSIRVSRARMVRPAAVAVVVVMAAPVGPGVLVAV